MYEPRGKNVCFRIPRVVFFSLDKLKLQRLDTFIEVVGSECEVVKYVNETV